METHTEDSEFLVRCEDRDGNNCGYMSWGGYPRDLDQAAIFETEGDAERAAENMLHGDYGYVIEPTKPL